LSSGNDAVTDVSEKLSYPEEGGGTFLGNVGNDLLDYTASHLHRKLALTAET
jgi:hypothetical protein